MMTNLQIQYNKYLEEQRANKAKEAQGRADIYGKYGIIIDKATNQEHADSFNSGVGVENVKAAAAKAQADTAAYKSRYDIYGNGTVGGIARLGQRVWDIVGGLFSFGS